MGPWSISPYHILDVVKELIKVMNAYAPEDVSKFCNKIVGISCLEEYESIKKNDVTKWVFYIMLLRQWPTQDFGTFIDYFQRYLYMFHSDTPGECGVMAEALPSMYGMTRKMFIPMSLTLFGTSVYVAEVEQWFNGKSEVLCTHIHNNIYL